MKKAGIKKIIIGASFRTIILLKLYRASDLFFQSWVKPDAEFCVSESVFKPRTGGASYRHLVWRSDCEHSVQGCRCKLKAHMTLDLNTSTAVRC